MIHNLRSLGALWCAAFFLLAGNGLLTSVLSAQLSHQGQSMTVTGGVMAAYFLGFLAGAGLGPRLIQATSHTTAFFIYGTATIVICLLHCIFTGPLHWGVLRLICGITTCGLFLVIESWIAAASSSAHRSRLLAVYMVVSCLGLAGGQLVLVLEDAMGVGLLVLAAALFAGSLVGVGGCRTRPGRSTRALPLSMANIVRSAPLGVLGCLVAGMTTGTFFSLMPAVVTAKGGHSSEMALILAVTLLGGLVGQPISGSLADRWNRRHILLAAAVAICVTSGLTALAAPAETFGLTLSMGLLGILMFTLYPLSMARTLDRCGSQDCVAVSAALLVAYSVGACIGPLLASAVIVVMAESQGIFVYWCLVNGLFTLVGLGLDRQGYVLEGIAAGQWPALSPARVSAARIESVKDRSM